MSNKRLYDLQELDWALSADEASLKEVRARLEDESEINAARARLQKLTAELDKRAPLRRTLESSLARLEERLQAAEQRLYGGAVTNPRELSASEEERRLLQEQRGAEEDRMLDVMVEIEELQSSRDATQELLGRLETDREAEYADLLQRQDALVVSIDELRRGRQQDHPGDPSGHAFRLRVTPQDPRRTCRREGRERPMPGMPPGAPDHGESEGQELSRDRPVQQLPAHPLRRMTRRRASCVR